MPKALNSTRRVQFLAERPDVCELCGEGPRDETIGIMSDDPRYDPWTIDHIITRSEGGSNNFHNLAKVHESCNMIRGAYFQYLCLEERRRAFNRPPIEDDARYRARHISALVNQGVDILDLYRSSHRNFGEASEPDIEEEIDS